MRKLIVLLLAAMAMSVGARQITPDEAAAVASEFLSSHERVHTAAKRVAVHSVKAKANAAAGLQPLYVFNADGGNGFVIVSGDDRTRPVLGYSNTGTFDFDNMSPALESMLEQYSEQIKALSALSSAAIKAEPAASDEWEAIEPLLTTKWGQGAPYNLECPMIDGEQAVTGCVATAFAQVMNYHKWPLRGCGSHSYEYEGKTFSMDFSQLEFDWELMMDKLNSSSSEFSKKAVATLMKACGYSINTYYGVSASSSVSEFIVKASQEYFDYSDNVHNVVRGNFSSEEWESLI